MLIKLTEIQQQTVRQYLADFGMESYLDKVVALIEEGGDSDICLLRLLHAFYQEGLGQGGLLVEQAWRNLIKRRRIVL